MIIKAKKILISLFVLILTVNNVKAAEPGVFDIKMLTEIPENGRLLGYGGNSDEILVSDKTGLKAYDRDRAEFRMIHKAENIVDAWVLGESTVIMKQDEYQNGLRYSSLVKISPGQGSELYLVTATRDLGVVQQSGDELFFMENAELKNYKAGEITKKTMAEGQRRIVNRKGELFLLQEGEWTEFPGPAEGIYINDKMSPEGQLLLFSIAGKGSYISDLNGRILHDLGYASAADWSFDGTYVTFMRDEDDGHVFTASDIYLYELETKSFINLTENDDSIFLYPHFSPDSYDILCNDMQGNIFEIILHMDTAGGEK